MAQDPLSEPPWFFQQAFFLPAFLLYAAFYPVEAFSCVRVELYAQHVMTLLTP